MCETAFLAALPSRFYIFAFACYCCHSIARYIFGCSWIRKLLALSNHMTRKNQAKFHQFRKHYTFNVVACCIQMQISLYVIRSRYNISMNGVCSRWAKRFARIQNIFVTLQWDKIVYETQRSWHLIWKSNYRRKTRKKRESRSGNSGDRMSKCI